MIDTDSIIYTAIASMFHDVRVNQSADGYDDTAPIYHDRAVVNLGPLSNVNYETSTDPADHDVQINYVVQLMDHENVTEGQCEMTS